MFGEIVDGIVSGRIRTHRHLQRAKVDWCEKHGNCDLPTNTEILASVDRDEPDWGKVRDFLRLKPVRSLSGVVVAAVMSSPASCPHGKCSYCPGGVDNNSPQSYTGREPAALRGAHDGFDPYLQTSARLRQLDACGHATDKVDLIIMGGTFPARTPEYQEFFVKRCFDAMNGQDSASLEEAHRLNMSAPSRCIGLTLESRPDWCKEGHVDRMLSLGTTRVELGVQTVRDDVLHNIGRGHTVQDSIDATRIAFDCGLKVCYHLMPGLPGITPEKDIADFRKIFESSDFRPDMLKIYPTLVIKGTRLYDDWKAARYEPYTTEQAAEVLAEVKRHIPPWVRIQRIQRDIPANLIDAGVKKSHLRMIVKERMRENGWECQCIRCREVGLASRDSGRNASEGNPGTSLRIEKYDAGGGREVFISVEREDTKVQNGILIAYARLRFPSQRAHRPEMKDGNTAIIRELKVHGEVVEIDENADGQGKWQHRGLGRMLMMEAERISLEQGYRTLLVNSGIGVRPYYVKLGYSMTGAYMGKSL